MKSALSLSPTPDILVVDDTHANLQLLSGMLKERGYKVRPAISGELALQSARHLPPDLVLLDINMPGLSGYEVAGRLKQDSVLRDIPIIFLSANTETLDKVRAFAAGGLDYVTKPFQFEEVAARVETHLKLRRLQVEMEQRNRQLQESNDALRQLQELRDNLTHMIVHDLRSPLAVMAGYLKMVIAAESERLSAKSAEFLTRADTASNRLLEMVNSLLDVSKMEAGKLELKRSDCHLPALGREVFTAFESPRLTCRLEMDVPAPDTLVSCDRDLIVRVLQNLVGNAIKFAPDGSAVRMVFQDGAATARASVIDSGRGIPAEFHARIFEKFGQVAQTGPRVGTGLGLTFCKLAIEAHGGRIGVESQPGQGSTFWFELPRAA